MATRKKAKGKTKAKRKKTSPTKATTRRKTTKVRKKLAKKAPARRASPKKARPAANAAIKPTPVSPPAQPVPAHANAHPARTTRSAGGADRHRDPLLQPPVSRDPAARFRYAARGRCNPHPRTHHRFQPEGRVPRSKSCACDRG